MWRPHGARQERRHKFTHRFMDAAGRWHAHEQAGPATIEAWRSSLAVFSAAAIMLNVASPATLSRYGTKFEERAQRYGRAWHICVAAEDRCRSEFLTTEKRRQERFHQEHPGLTAYDASRPWETVLREAATNVEHWQRELQEPALLYTQSRGDAAPSWVKQQQEQRGQKRDSNAMNDDAAEYQEKEICKNWNRGKCHFKNCPRLHVCETCRKTGHQAKDCKVGKGNRHWKQGKKGKGKGGQK